MLQYSNKEVDELIYLWLATFTITSTVFCHNYISWWKRPGSPKCSFDIDNHFTNKHLIGNRSRQGKAHQRIGCHLGPTFWTCCNVREACWSLERGIGKILIPCNDIHTKYCECLNVWMFISCYKGGKTYMFWN